MTSPSDVPPLRVGPGHVPEQVAVRPGVGVEQQGQVAGDQAAFAVRGQDGEAVPPDELVELGRVVLGEGGGDVHGSANPSDYCLSLVVVTIHAVESSPSSGSTS